MDSRAVYEEVARLARLPSPEEGREVTHRVLRSIAACAPGQTLDRLRAALPDELARELAGARPEADELIDSQVFVGRLVDAMDTEFGYDLTLGGLDLNSVYRDDDASLQARAVFAVLRRRLDDGLARMVRDALPPELREWWDAGP